MTKVKRLYVPIGPAGCGKGTYFIEVLKIKDVVRISADDIRFRILDYENTGNHYDPTIEKEVWEEVNQTLLKRMNEGVDIYYDCTNLFQTCRYKLNMYAKKYGYRVLIIFFKIPLATILKQNASRKRQLDEKIIAKHFFRMEEPQPWESDTLFILNEKWRDNL